MDINQYGSQRANTSIRDRYHDQQIIADMKNSDIVVVVSWISQENLSMTRIFLFKGFEILVQKCQNKNENCMRSNLPPFLVQLFYTTI